MWKVRYAGVKGLMRVTRALEGQTNRDGLHGLAWEALAKINAAERDARVAEAFKVGQVGSVHDSALHASSPSSRKSLSPFALFIIGR